MIFKYRRTFGIIRIFLGILLLVYPVYEYLQQKGELSEDSMTLLFVMIFFLLYSYSAISNGIREISLQMPAFNLLRFFEAAMNGFLGLYLLIITVAMKIAITAKILILLLAIIIIVNMVRDLRLISIQYVEKRRNQKPN